MSQFLNLVIMNVLVKRIQPTKNGNDLYRTCIAEELVTETEDALTVQTFDAKVVDVELAKKMQKAMTDGKKVELNFKMTL